MFRLLYRQRRRILFTAFFTTMALMLFVVQTYWAAAVGDFPAWISYTSLALTSLIVAICVGLLTALLILVFPNWRMIAELFALTLFVNVTLDMLFPSLFETTYIGGFLQLAVYFALFALMYGEVMDRFRIWVDHHSTRSFNSPKPADELWAELVPGEAALDTHWDSLLCALEPDAEEDGAYDARYALGASVFEHQTMTILEKDAPHYAKYHHVGDVNPNNRNLVEGTFAIRITPLEKGGCKVTLEGRRSLLLLRVALLMWFDDYLGDQTDHIRARHLGRRDWSETGRFRRKVGQFA
ncbi:MAG: hypothetical protein AAF307_11390 [Pseudomonadota bacterium]